MKQLGLYVHIPFCIEKCRYCDFLSYGGSDESLHSSYVEALCREIAGSDAGLASGNKHRTAIGSGADSAASHAGPGDGLIIDTIFFGGGTPSLLDQKHTERILNLLFERFPLAQDPEISLEANPGTLSVQKLSAYKRMGINRLSIGAQSLDDDLLRFMGRVHSASDFREAFREARKAGFDNINVDLMFGVPGQTLSSWEETLKEALSMEPEHISFYSLQLEEGTPFYRMFLAGTLPPVSEELDREMYRRALHALNKKGYIHYEISNAAQPGFLCRHNLKYWTMEDYLGFGLGAHSYRQGRRFGNETDLAAYLKHPGAAWQHENSGEDEISEYLFTGLRLMNGISFDEFERRFGVSLWDLHGKAIDRHCKDGLLEIDERRGRLRFTAKGVDLSNQVLMEFV